MIIVEGPDNAGKSTLIQQLLDLDGSLRLLHRDKFDPKKGETIGSSYLRVLVGGVDDRVTHANSICDRFLASEEIYGKLFRGGSRLAPGERWAIRNLLLSYGAMVVHCDPGDRALRASWHEREQLYNQPLTIAKEYRKQMPLIFSGVPIHPYNYKAFTAEHRRVELIALHRSYLAEQRDALTWWGALPFGAGQLRSPNVVIIGEGLSPKAWTTVPFAHGPAGDFLAWALERAYRKLDIAPLSGLYVTNADKGSERNAAMLRAELRFLMLPENAVIITLGKEAAELMRFVAPSVGEDLEAKIAELPHPQYWRRFHYGRKAEYVTMLVNALKALPEEELQ
jgi:uracil-DNA glycosylase